MFTDSRAAPEGGPLPGWRWLRVDAGAQQSLAAEDGTIASASPPCGTPPAGLRVIRAVRCGPGGLLVAACEASPKARRVTATVQRPTRVALHLAPVT